VGSTLGCYRVGRASGDAAALGEEISAVFGPACPHDPGCGNFAARLWAMELR